MQVEKMRKDIETNAFNFFYDRILKPNEEVIVVLPRINPNARGVNDIGFTRDAPVKMFATIDHIFISPETQWQEIISNRVNKTVRALKVRNEGSEATRFLCRVILN